MTYEQSTLDRGKLDKYAIRVANELRGRRPLTEFRLRQVIMHATPARPRPLLSRLFGADSPPSAAPPTTLFLYWAVARIVTDGWIFHRLGPSGGPGPREEKESATALLLREDGQLVSAMYRRSIATGHGQAIPDHTEEGWVSANQPATDEDILFFDLRHGGRYSDYRKPGMIEALEFDYTCRGSKYHEKGVGASALLTKLKNRVT